MLFNTLDYAWFLALVFVVAWLLVQRRFALLLPWLGLSGYALSLTVVGAVQPTDPDAVAVPTHAWPSPTPLVLAGLVAAGLALTVFLIARTPPDQAPSRSSTAIQLGVHLALLSYLTIVGTGLDPFSYGLSTLRVPVRSLGWGTWGLFVAGSALSFALLVAKKVRLLCILLASYVFYAHWDYRFLPLIWGSSSADWWLAKKIATAKSKRSQKAWLMGTVAVNLGVLGFFKYFNFGVDSMSAALSALGFHPPEIVLRVALPVGISFFTFESMSYVIDVYRKELPPHESYAEYLSFVAFFPHLVAGPIVRPRDLLPQLADRGRFHAPQASEGLFLIAVGLGKKIIVGDYLALNLVDRVFDAPAMYSAVETYAAVLGYALQIYCDFSGYTDIAIGSALLLGVRFPLNFDSPYKAHNIVDFWRRWHISLSTWLRDYLYIPLGGNRKGRARTYLNLLITMVLGGLWHGAAWTFVVWGFLHGAALALNKWFEETRGRVRRSRAERNTKRNYDNLAFEDLPDQVDALTHGPPTIPPQSGSRRKKTKTISDQPTSGPLVTRPGASKKGPETSAPTPPAADLELTGKAQGSGIEVRREKKVGSLLAHAVSVFLTVHFVCACWIFFRAESFAKAQLVFARLASASSHHQNLPPSVLGVLALGIVGHYVPDKWFSALRDWFIAVGWPIKALLLYVAAWVLRQMASTDAVPFVYFQF